MRDFTTFSDHRPLELVISIPNKFRFEIAAYNFQKISQRHKWKNDSAEKFNEAQKTQEFDDKFDHILEHTYGNSTEGCEQLNKEIINPLTSIADSVIPKCKGLLNRFKKRWFEIKT